MFVGYGYLQKKGMICLITAAQNEEQAVFFMWKYLIFQNLLKKTMAILTADMSQRV